MALEKVRQKLTGRGIVRDCAVDGLQQTLMAIHAIQEVCRMLLEWTALRLSSCLCPNSFLVCCDSFMKADCSGSDEHWISEIGKN